MKRIISIFTLILLLHSCSSEFKPATFETITIDTSFKAEISATFDKAVGNTELSKKINTNIEIAISETLSSPENNDDLETILKAFNIEYVNFKKDFPDASETVWELSIETEKIYQSEDIITFAISTYEFQGGAHGNDKIKFLNLNAKTGNILNINEMIDLSEAFKDIAKTFFLKNIETREENLKMEDFFFGKPFQLPENIGFSDDGLVLLYNVYEVASYAQGYTEFAIPFEEVQSYLKVN